MKKLIIAIILASCMMPLSALQSFRELLPGLTEEQYQSLTKGDALEADTIDTSDIVLIAPAGGITANRAASAKAVSDEKNFSVARTCLIPYPEKWAKDTVAERQLDIFNTMRQISTQQGITYISHRRGDRPYPLFEDTYYISDPDNIESKMPDPIATEFPKELVSYAYQVDTSFDGNVYRHTYKNSDEEIFLDVTNYTPMKYRGLTCLQKETLSLCMSSYQTKEGLLVYSLAQAKNRTPVVTILFWKVYLTSSFMKRMTSLQDWFKGRIALVK